MAIVELKGSDDNGDFTIEFDTDQLPPEFDNLETMVLARVDALTEGTVYLDDFDGFLAEAGGL